MVDPSMVDPSMVDPSATDASTTVEVASDGSVRSPDSSSSPPSTPSSSNAVARWEDVRRSVEAAASAWPAWVRRFSALALYRRGDQLQVLRATRRVADCFLEGWAGVCEASAAEAARWYESAASRWDGHASFRLALLHAQGLGVPVNLTEAWRRLDEAEDHDYLGEAPVTLTRLFVVRTWLERALRSRKADESDDASVSDDVASETIGATLAELWTWMTTEMPALPDEDEGEDSEDSEDGGDRSGGGDDGEAGGRGRRLNWYSRLGPFPLDVYSRRTLTVVARAVGATVAAMALAAVLVGLVLVQVRFCRRRGAGVAQPEPDAQ